MRKRVTPHRCTPDGRWLASRRMVAFLAGRDPETVARHCEPAACDVANRTPLYDVGTSLEVLAARRAGRVGAR